MESSLQDPVTSRNEGYLQRFSSIPIKEMFTCSRRKSGGQRYQVRIRSSLEGKPVQIIESKDRVTWNRVIKFHKVMWNNHSEQNTTWEMEDYLREVYPSFYEKWYVFQILGRDFYKGAVTP